MERSIKGVCQRLDEIDRRLERLSRVNRNTATTRDPIWDSRNSDEPMSANLPGQQVTTNVPPLPNTTPDNPRKVVSITVDSFELVAREVFAVLRDKGQPAADALLAEIQRLRAP